MIHVDNYRENLREIERLMGIHRELTGNRVGYRSNVEVLNKSSIVLLVACWEAFVEDLASGAFEFMLSHASEHSAFPAKVLALASKGLRESKDERAVWAIAGEGWRNVLSDHKDSILRTYLANFNTPRAISVDLLFHSLIGLTKLSSNWHWRKMSAQQAKEFLDKLITLRGDIAHRVSSSKSVKKEDVIKYSTFIARLTVISSNAVRDFVHDSVGQYPWNNVYLVKD